MIPPSRGPAPDGVDECWCHPDALECPDCDDHGFTTSRDGGEAACPWCGAEHGDMFEHKLGDGESVVVECGCGKSFRATAEITYTLKSVRVTP